jgi:hypothetical protein
VVSKLHQILKPFLLRRVKTDVETSLPGKMEVILYAGMTERQRELNQQLRDKTLNVSEPEDGGKGLPGWLAGHTLLWCPGAARECGLSWHRSSFLPHDSAVAPPCFSHHLCLPSFPPFFPTLPACPPG